MKATRFCSLVLCSAVLILCSCKKNSSASGQVTDVFTGKGLEGVAIFVTETKQSLGPNLPGDSWSGQTDVSGNFSVQFVGKRKGKYSYFVAVENSSLVDTTVANKKDFIQVIEGNSLTEVSNKGVDKLHFKLAPAARIILLFRNPQNKPVDQIVLTPIINGSPGMASSGQGGVQPVETMLLPTNGTAFLKIDLTSGGSTRTWTESIPCNAFEIKRHEITL